MNFGLSLVTPPAAEPVSLSLAKQAARIRFSDDNALIEMYISAARLYCETFTRRSFVATTWNLTLDSFPPYDHRYYFLGCQLLAHESQDYYRHHTIELPLPALSVSSIKYTDPSGSVDTLDPTQFYVDTSRQQGRITPAVGCCWPGTLRMPSAVTVQFVAGYGTTTDQVPATIKQAICQLVAHWYERRTPAEELQLYDVPFSVQSLLLSERWGQYP
jgi:hypothetical protein